MEIRLTKDGMFWHVSGLSDSEAYALKEHLTYQIPYIWKLKKQFPGKYDHWDGKTHFINSRMMIPRGLWNECIIFAKQHNLSFACQGLERIIDNNFDYEKYKDFCNELLSVHPVYDPYDYQLESTAKILKYKFNQSEIATSAGKTLMQWMMFNWLKHSGIKKQMIIVPTRDLVTQLISDFDDYANDEISFTYQKMMGGESKEIKDVDFIVGTYQTLTKLKHESFTGVEALFIDECHTSKNKSIKKVIDTIIPQLKFVYGMSGTLNTKERDIFLSTQTYLGPLIQSITPKFLMDNGYATDLRIKAYVLNYLSTEKRKALQTLRKDKNATPAAAMSNERDVIRNSDIRFNFITDKILKTENNSLVLFSDVKNGYGKRFYEYLKNYSSKNVYYIDGNTKSENREYFKKAMDDSDCILVASYGTLSTGLSIKNIHNIFLTESYKSRIVVMQSLGRAMRKLKGKVFANIFDFIDDFRVVGGAKAINYAYDHGLIRIRYYKNYYNHFEVEDVDMTTSEADVKPLF